MPLDKRAQSARVVGWFCIGFAIAATVLEVVWLGLGHEVTLMMLGIGICLLAVGVAVLASARPKG